MLDQAFQAAQTTRRLKYASIFVTCLGIVGFGEAAVAQFSPDTYEYALSPLAILMRSCMCLAIVAAIAYFNPQIRLMHRTVRALVEVGCFLFHTCRTSNFAFRKLYGPEEPVPEDIAYIAWVGASIPILMALSEVNNNARNH